jgi:drug/metabolite transporter (DMT)-like permease
MSSHVRPIEERRLTGIAFVVIGYFFFTIIDSCAKWLSLAGLPTTEIVFVRYAGQLLFVSAIFLPARGVELVRTRSPKLEIARALCLLGSTISNFFAIRYLPLTVTGSIAFTMPLILCALSIPLLGEQVGWRRWLAILVGFAGVLIIVRPGTEAFHPAIFASLAGAVFTAFYMLLTRKLAGVDSTTTQQFYGALVASACIGIFALNGWVWPSDIAGWTAFVLIGLSALIGHQFLTTAHRYAPATVLAPFSYLQIIFMTASSWLIFSQPPDMWIYVGAAIVIASGLYIWLRERQLARPVVTELAAQD